MFSDSLLFMVKQYNTERESFLPYLTLYSK